MKTMIGSYEVNNIYCADCYDAIKSIPDRSIDLIVTDPPYRFSQGINPRKTFTSKGKQEELNLHYETMSDKEIIISALW